MNDLISRGIIAGLLGSVGDALIHHLGSLLLRTSTTAHYISQLMFPFKDVNTVRYLYGFSVHFFAGALAGIGLSLIIKYSGKDHAFVKGIGFAITMWIVHVIIIPNIVQPRPYLFRTELEALVDFMAHIAFGAVATIYLLKVQPQTS